jgi:predicted methyltransferase
MSDNHRLRALQMRRRSLIIALALAVTLGGVAALCLAQEALQKEAERLAEVLSWKPGGAVGEIGAGGGELTLAAAKRVGGAGRVYTTELDPKKLAHLEKLAEDQKNITALKAGEAGTSLPQDCCDSVFMRLVYHHLSKPAEIDASLFQSLKPGGLLAVIDMEPRAGSSRVEGVPENRGGHGVPQRIMIEELTSAGFQMQKVYNDWPDDNYCVVFRKPGP